LQHNPADYHISGFTELVNSLVQEDALSFENSFFFAALNNGHIVGSAKVTRWDHQIILPIQNLFDIDPSDLVVEQKITNLWHVGRFAISKSEKDGARLLKKLITLAIYPICMSNDSIMVAECDRKFVRGLNLLGIQTGLLGRGIHYLGSETLPIYSTREWLSNFLVKSPYFEEAREIYDRDDSTLRIIHCEYLYTLMPDSTKML